MSMEYSLATDRLYTSNQVSSFSDILYPSINFNSFFLFLLFIQNILFLCRPIIYVVTNVYLPAWFYLL